MPSPGLASMLDGLFECAYVVDRQRRIVLWNRSAEEITGHPVRSVTGSLCNENILAHVDEWGKPLCDDCCPLAQAAETRESRTTTVYFQHRLGHRVRVNLRTIPILEQDDTVGWLVLFCEASEMAALRARMADLEKLALLDPLTGTGNRRMAAQLMEMRQSALDRYGWGFGLALLDVDGLKTVNDVHGHSAGDAMLRAFAATAMSTLRPSDFLCRWGGDEFLLVLEGTSLRDVESACERIRAIVESTQVPIAETRLSVTISAGATVGVVGEKTETSLSRVDRLLYGAKRDGRNTIRSA